MLRILLHPSHIRGQHAPEFPGEGVSICRIGIPIKAGIAFGCLKFRPGLGGQLGPDYPARPYFLESDTFRTEIPLQFASLGAFARHWQTWLGLPGSALSHLELSLQKVSLPADQANNSWEQVILYLVLAWHQKGTKLSALDWPDNQKFDVDKIKKVPSWAEKSTNLLHKKVGYLISILSLSAEPISLNELMSIMGYKNRKTFRTNYMQPLEKSEWIARTNPKVPFDPEQKYYLTDAGKAFLGGTER